MQDRSQSAIHAFVSQSDNFDKILSPEDRDQIIRGLLDFLAAWPKLAKYLIDKGIVIKVKFSDNEKNSDDE